MYICAHTCLELLERAHLYFSGLPIVTPAISIAKHAVAQGCLPLPSLAHPLLLLGGHWVSAGGGGLCLHPACHPGARARAEGDAGA